MRGVIAYLAIATLFYPSCEKDSQPKQSTAAQPVVPKKVANPKTIFVHTSTSGWIPAQNEGYLGPDQVLQTPGTAVHTVEEYEQLVNNTKVEATFVSLYNTSFCAISRLPRPAIPLALEIRDPLTDEQLNCVRELKPMALKLTGISLDYEDLIKIVGSVKSAQYLALNHKFPPGMLHQGVKHLGVDILASNRTNLLAGAPHLQSLALGAHLMSNEDVEKYLADLPLETLQLKSSQTLSTTQALAQLTTLKSLTLSHHPLDDDDLVPLSALSNLQELTLTNLQLSDAANFSTLPDLYKLNISNNAIGDAAFATLEAQRNLQLLDAHSTKIQSCGASLQKLVNLETLFLDNTAVGDEEVKIISQLPKLRELSLAKTSITDKSLEYLSAARALQMVNIKDTSVTPVAVQNLINSSEGLILRH